MKFDFAVGGQAVIEGVMMRSPNFISIAVRKPKGGIELKTQQFSSLTKRLKVLSLPILRGMINLVEMMKIGFQAMNFSAKVFMDAEETTQKTLKDKIIETISLIFSFAFAIALSLFLFKFLPLWITDFLSKKFDILNKNYFLFNLIDGILKTSFFLIYIALLAVIPSFRRIFEYHGAEHKSIFTYEKDIPLTVENAKQQIRFHPRCGTSFIFIVFLISILVYTLIPRHPVFLTNFLIRLAFLPLIAGISYEYLKISAKHASSKFVKILIAPGLWLQRITTSEPKDDQLDVALMALQKTLEMEKEPLIA